MIKECLLFLLGYIFHHVATQDCYTVRLKHAGEYLETGTEFIAEFKAGQLTTCVKECMARNSCKSVRFDQEMGICGLMTQDSLLSSAVFEINPRYVHTDMSEWPRVRN